MVLNIQYIYYDMFLISSFLYLFHPGLLIVFVIKVLPIFILWKFYKKLLILYIKM